MPSGPKPLPPGAATDRNARAHPWNHAPGVGWQHGRRPSPPRGLGEAAKTAWAVWFDAWFAAFWSPADLPGLRQVARLFDLVDKDLAQLGESKSAAELRQLMAAYGLTPKARQDLRWAPALEVVDGPSVAVPDEVSSAREARKRRLA